MTRPESAAGRWQATGTAGQSTSTASLAERGDVGKQGATLAVLLTDAAVDQVIERAAAGRAALTIAEIVQAMGAAADDRDARAAVWLRLHGETLLRGLPGHVQRANALRLMHGDDPLSAPEIERIIRAHAPGATAALVDDVLAQFAEHLRSEGRRLAAEANVLGRTTR